MESVEMKGRGTSQESKSLETSSPTVQKIGSVSVCCSERLKIKKQLIPLKLALFFWYGGALVLQTFLPVYFKQLGLSVNQQSLIYIVAPPVQFLGPTISGLIADKMGRAKPVLYANIALTLIFVNAMLLIPNVEQPRCVESTIEINCSSVVDTINRGFDLNETEFSKLAKFDIQFCNVWCLFDNFDEDKLIPNKSTPFYGSIFRRRREDFFSVNRDNISDSNRHSYNKTLKISSLNVSWCEEHIACHLNCSGGSNEECDKNEPSNMMLVFVLSFIIIISFNCTFSNCYRFMDVTCMAMVKKYDSDFGRERFWAIVSGIVLSPLAGYLIRLTTTENGPENYASAIYFFDATTLITVFTIIKLDVQINPPGKHLWRKALSLGKNADALLFAFVLLVLGASWCFTKFYSPLFLHQLNAQSMLLSLIPSVSGLVGLPFLATSNWWMKKIGSSNLLIAALFGYVFQCIGYSFLVDPWYSLIFEIFGIFTYHLGWVSAVVHSHKIAPDGLTAFTIATAGGLHYGIGKGTGSGIGLIMGNYGARTAYRFTACMCGATGLIYLSFRWFRRHYRRTCQDQKTTKS